MEGSDLSAPANVVTSFSLPVRDAHGRGDGISVELAALAWTGGAGARRRLFDDIATIELEAETGGDDPFARCDIEFNDGAHLLIRLSTEGRPDMARAYREFVATFFDRLGPAHRARIVFREGSRPLTRLVSIVTCIVLIVLLLGVLMIGIVSGAFWQEDSAWLGIPLILLFVVLLSLGLRGTLKSGQQTFDPLAPPSRALPDAPR